MTKLLTKEGLRGAWRTKAVLADITYAGPLKQRHMRTPDYPRDAGADIPDTFIVQCADARGIVSSYKSARAAEAMAEVLAGDGIRVGVTTMHPEVDGAELWLVKGEKTAMQYNEEKQRVQALCDGINHHNNPPHFTRNAVAAR